MNLLLLIASLTSAYADEALRGRVLDLLSGMEEPATAADLAALGADVGVELQGIARDTNVLPTQRGNALVALGHYPSDDVRSLLSGVLRDNGGNKLLRRKACTGLAVGFGDAAVPELVAIFAENDTMMSTAVVQALGTIGTPTAKSALEEQLASEKNNSVRTALSTSIARIK